MDWNGFANFKSGMTGEPAASFQEDDESWVKAGRRRGREFKVE